MEVLGLAYTFNLNAFVNSLALQLQDIKLLRKLNADNVTAVDARLHNRRVHQYDRDGDQAIEKQNKRTVDQ